MFTSAGMKQMHPFILNIQTTVSTTGKTGVGNGSFNRCINQRRNHYDMTLKAVDKGMIIGKSYLESKSGGKSGDFQRQSNQ